MKGWRAQRKAAGRLPSHSGSVGAFVSLSASSELAVRGAGNTSAWSVGAQMGNAEQSEMENYMHEQYGKYSDICSGAPWWAFVFIYLSQDRHTSPAFTVPCPSSPPLSSSRISLPPSRWLVLQLYLLPAHPRGCISPAGKTSSLWLCFGGAFRQA